MKVPAITIGLVLLAGRAALAQGTDETIGISVDLWFADMKGTMQADAAGSPGTEIDVDDTLSIDEFDKGIGALDAWLNIPTMPFKVRFLSAGAQNDKTVNLASPVVFAGRTFTTASPVQGEIIFRRYVLALDWSPPELFKDVADLDVAVIFGFEYVSHTLRMTQSGTETGRSVRALDAYLGGRVTWTLYNQFQIEGILAFTPGARLNDRDYASIEGSVEFRWIFTDNFRFGVGYRFLTLDAEDAANSPDVDRFDVDIQGLFVRGQLVW